MAALALAAFLCVCLGGAASAAAPANDNFADAAVLSGLPATATGTNVDATKESGEPNHISDGAGGHSVWWSWTAPSDGDVTLDTCSPNTDFNTQLAVYIGSSVEALTPVASNDLAFDNCGIAGASKLSFTAHSGQVYKIAVDGTGGETGNIALALNKSPQPANDDFANAADLGDTGGFSLGSNAGASKEKGGPNHAGDPGGHSVWWKWTAPASGGVTVSTCAGTGGQRELDTVLAVYTGDSVGALSEVASNDQGPPGCGKQSAVHITASAGQTYRIAVDSAGGAIGGFTLSETAGPVNDWFADATPLSGLSASDLTVNAGATSEPGEPNHAGNAAGQSLWWRWTAPVNGSVQVDTCHSVNFGGFDTVLAVYTGDAVDALTAVASNDDSPSCAHFNPAGGAVGFHASAGQTYHIAVDGAAPDNVGFIDVRLEVTAASGGPPPPPTKAGATGGDDMLTGTPGPDLICGLGGSDVIKGLGGNDTLFGDACGVTPSTRSLLAAKRGGNDSLFGGRGNDKLYGAGGKDRLFGERGSDTLYGGRGNDLLHGNTGRDRLRGGPGNDLIRARDGRRDTINCGPGRDRVRADNQDRLRGCELIRQ